MVVSTGSARIQLCIATFTALSPRRLGSGPGSYDRAPLARVHFDVHLLELCERRRQVLGVALIGPLALLGRRAERVADHAGGRELLVVRREEEELMPFERDVGSPV